MKTCIWCLLLGRALVFPVYGQYQPEEISMADGSRFLMGVLAKEDLLSEPYRAWFDPGYRAYQPNHALVQNLKPLLHNIYVLVFLGTWCGDSQREIPRLIRILDEAGLPPNRLKLVGVDRRRATYKTSPGGEQWGFNIQRVPTVILLRNGKEVGRIVERPATGLELDLCDLLSCSPSLPRQD